MKATIDTSKSRPVQSAFLKVLVIVWSVSAVCCMGEREKTEALVSTPVQWSKPAGFPDPAYNLSKNPLTKEGVLLGKMLFYEPMLSNDNTVSCASCHRQEFAFSDGGAAMSRGIQGQRSVRNTPAVQNIAWNPVFFWDGGVHDLDFAPLNPIQNPAEMGETIKNVIVKLKGGAAAAGKDSMDYPKMFKEAFGTSEITTERLMKALSQFMVTMVSADSRYDRFVAGDTTALNREEQEGLLIFKDKCASCHTGELFTGSTFRNNGLRPSKADPGRYEITRRDADKYKFKVPGLRNIVYTAPYMHDGRFKTLQSVMEHYSSRVFRSETLDSLLIRDQGEAGIPLTAREKKNLIAFLGALSDEKFLKDPTLSDPNVSVYKKAAHDRNHTSLTKN